MITFGPHLTQMKYLSVILLLLLTPPAIAQEGDKTATIYSNIKEMPEPDYDLDAFLNKNLKYPDSARKSGIGGMVSVQFLVHEDGKITNLRALSKIGQGCETEAIRVFGMMPPWKPGKFDHKPVIVRCARRAYFNKETMKAGPDTVAGNKPKPQVYQLVEQMPVPGFSINDYLSANMNYPVNARKRGVAGRVAIQFVINTDGTISDALVSKGIDKDLDEEALRVIKNMPPWKPGKQNGVPVRVMYTQPITFKLD